MNTVTGRQCHMCPEIAFNDEDNLEAIWKNTSTFTDLHLTPLCTYIQMQKPWITRMFGLWNQMIKQTRINHMLFWVIIVNTI